MGMRMTTRDLKNLISKEFLMDTRGIRIRKEGSWVVVTIKEEYANSNAGPTVLTIEELIVKSGYDYDTYTTDRGQGDMEVPCILVQFEK
jgi:hypothetical protein